MLLYVLLLNTQTRHILLRSILCVLPNRNKKVKSRKGWKSFTSSWATSGHPPIGCSTWPSVSTHASLFRPLSPDSAMHLYRFFPINSNNNPVRKWLLFNTFLWWQLCSSSLYSWLGLCRRMDTSRSFLNSWTKCITSICRRSCSLTKFYWRNAHKLWRIFKLLTSSVAERLSHSSFI